MPGGRAGAGNDEIDLGSDDDLYGAHDLGALDGGSGNHAIIGGAGRARIEDHGGAVFIEGEHGNDLILSPDASDPERPDTLLGGTGDDAIHAGAGDLVEGGDGADLIVLRSDAGGAADIAYAGGDTIAITLAEDYAGAEEYVLVLDGDDVAILRDTLVRDVGTITLDARARRPDRGQGSWRRRAGPAPRAFSTICGQGVRSRTGAIPRGRSRAGGSPPGRAGRCPAPRRRSRPPASRRPRPR
ncbi:hypothetical protein SAMN04244548_02484 [Paracoccus pantotrophus]|nr:hypothetical protein SAMN04244548_02484 [Paracoccus pantotrophus]